MGIRCFLAIDLPDSVQNLLRTTIGQLSQTIPASAVRWVDPKLSHLTLHFLGNAVVPEVVAWMQKTGRAVAAKYAPLSLQTGGLKVFPRFGQPNVISVACDGKDAHVLHALRAEFGAAIKTLGLNVDARPWQPHLTLARFRRPLRSRPGPMTLPRISFTADAVTLYRSTLTPTGPQYDQLDRFDCNAKPATAT